MCDGVRKDRFIPGMCPRFSNSTCYITKREVRGGGGGEERGGERRKIDYNEGPITRLHCIQCKQYFEC